MGLSRAEVNLRRLLDAAPQQNNRAKLIHYVMTARELLENIEAEAASDRTSSIWKAKLNEYSQKIEDLASNIASPVPEDSGMVDEAEKEESILQSEQTVKVKEINIVSRSQEESWNLNKQLKNSSEPSVGLRRRPVTQAEDKKVSHLLKEKDDGAPIRLDDEAHAHIERHRQLQEDLTDEMVVLARQLKESSLLMNQSLKGAEKILDSTESAIESSLATTSRVNTQATAVYSLTSKTTCLTWLLIFLMSCLFIMVVLLIRVT